MAGGLPAVLEADSCGPGGGTNCYYATDLVTVDYGTLTLLAPDGSLISNTNIVTAESTLPPGFPAGYAAFFPSLIGQLEGDIQSSYAGLPSWLFTDLANLEDANGFGFVPDTPDPAEASFDAQLADVGGPYQTLSDTGYQAPPFSQAYCDLSNSVLPGSCGGPQDGSDFSFTYQLGPDNLGGNIYTSLINFEFYSRDVTEQLTAAPEPRIVVLMGIGLVLLAVLAIARGKRPRDTPPGR